MNPVANEQIVDACLSIINDEISFIEGCRNIVSLRNQFNLTMDQDFSPLVGVVSETDEYPEEAIRKNFSADYLEKIEDELSGYILEVKPIIIASCRTLASKYSSD